MDILERLMKLWNKLAYSPALPPLQLVFPQDRTDKILGEVFKPNQHYFEVRIDQMFLTDYARWFDVYLPMLMVVSEFFYNGEKQVVPYIGGPDRFRKQGIKIPGKGRRLYNTRVAGIHPYRGGNLTLAVILYRVRQVDYTARLLHIVENAAGALDFATSLDSYAKIAPVVLDGVEALFDSGYVEPVMGLRRTIEPLIPGYFALVNTSQAETATDQFWVRNSELVSGENLFQAQTYEGADFILGSIVSDTRRKDIEALPFYKTWQHVEMEAGQSEAESYRSAKANMCSLYQAMVLSPDLIKAQADELGNIFNGLIENRRREADNRVTLTGATGEFNRKAVLPNKVRSKSLAVLAESDSPTRTKGEALIEPKESPAPQDRYVNLWFTRRPADAPEIPKYETLAVRVPVYLRVQIAAFDERTILAEARPFPSQEEIETAFPKTKGKPLNLEATIFSNDFQIAPGDRTQKLKLVRGQPTEVCYFRLVPTRLGWAELRVCVFFQNHLLQSLHVGVMVAENAQAIATPQRAEVEMTFSANFDRIPPSRRRRLFLGLNQSPDGSHTINIKGDKVAISRRLTDKLPVALELARQALSEVSFSLEPDPMTNTPQKVYRFTKDNTPKGVDPVKRFQKDLVRLAIAGRNLYDAVFGTGATLTAEERDELGPLVKEMKGKLRQAQVVQVARLKLLEDIWPWALMYDFVLDPDQVDKVCLAFRGNDGRPLPFKKGSAGCSHCGPGLRHRDKTMVCPYGFWGFRHIIEQPTQPGGRKAFEDLVTEVNIAGIPVYEMPLANELNRIEPEHIEHMVNLQFQTLDSYTKIISALDPEAVPPPPEPHIVYFFCHGKYDATDNPYLLVGDKDSLSPSELDDMELSWKKSKGLVFLNGCHTVDLKPKDLSVIMAPFVKAYASGIIGTEVSVHTNLAREFAEEFFTRLLPSDGNAKGQEVGDIIHDIRLELLMKYNPLGLVYTPFCSASLVFCKK